MKRLHRNLKQELLVQLFTLKVCLAFSFLGFTFYKRNTGQKEDRIAYFVEYGFTGKLSHFPLLWSLTREQSQPNEAPVFFLPTQTGFTVWKAETAALLFASTGDMKLS